MPCPVIQPVKLMPRTLSALLRLNLSPQWELHLFVQLKAACNPSIGLKKLTKSLHRWLNIAGMVGPCTLQTNHPWGHTGSSVNTSQSSIICFCSTLAWWFPEQWDSSAPTTSCRTPGYHKMQSLSHGVHMVAISEPIKWLHGHKMSDLC